MAAQRGQATIEYVGVVGVVVLVVAAVVVMTTPVGATIKDSQVCASQGIGSTQEGGAACASAAAADEDEPLADRPGGTGLDVGLRCDPEWDFCQPGELEEGDVPVCFIPLGTLGCGVQEIDGEDCAVDDSCEDVWDGAMDPDETEGDIEKVDWSDCNFNVLGWYPNDHVRFSWEANSLSGAGAGNPSVCVDGSGTMNIDQGGVERFDAGDHTGWFIYKGADGYEYKHSFEKDETSYFDPSTTVYEVHID